jgi:halimadienyl-diphosphate synthase
VLFSLQKPSALERGRRDSFLILRPWLYTDHLLKECAGDRDRLLGGGCIGASPYDTAWVARIRDPQSPDTLLFPKCMEWLLQHQHADGSWGEFAPYTLLPTMAAMLALAHAPQPTDQQQSALQRAREYIVSQQSSWSLTQIDTPFWEFLIPTLHHDLAEAGIDLPIPGLDEFVSQMNAKLQRVPWQTIGSGHSILTHCMEACPSSVPMEQILLGQSPNGGFGNSVASTAAVVLRGQNQAALRLLKYVVEKSDGGVPTSFPSDVFETAWILDFFIRSNIPVSTHDSSFRSLINWLKHSLTSEGAGFARPLGLPPDVDDTAMTITVLRGFGLKSTGKALRHFERETHFTTYAHESAVSISANAHVLSAIATFAPDERVRWKKAQDKIIEMLRAHQSRDGYWEDKWHVSPFYATLTSILALTDIQDVWSHVDYAKTLSWLLDTQRDDGGWGVYHSTCEETAYALMALLHIPIPASSNAIEIAVQRSIIFLINSWQTLNDINQLPSLWIDKVLYMPPRVIEAAVIAALYCAYIRQGHWRSGARLFN